MADIKTFLEQRERDGLLRALRPIASRGSGRMRINGTEYVDFSSNDYLGLSGHPVLIVAAKRALDEFGAGSSASRLLSGSLDIHHRLEEEVARFKNKERALVFNSGYQANVGILSALYGAGDVIFSDKLNHASIIDGMMLSGARIFRFLHNDPDSLEALIRKERAKYKNALIVTETIFSMDGDRPPLKALAGLKEKYDCRLMADEAHATGVFGPNGAGVVEEEGLTDRIDLIMGTFSKGLGSFGAYIAASGDIVDYLINTCRSFIYSTSLPPAVIAANRASIGLVKEEPARRQTLLARARDFRASLDNLGFQTRGQSQIVPVIVGSSERAVKLSEALAARGHWALPIRPPTVPSGQARVRFSLTYHHTEEMLEKLLEDIADVKI